MKLIIAGGRKFKNYNKVRIEVLSFLQRNGISLEEVEIVSGGAPGADRMGEIFAKLNNLPLTIFPADWEKYGNAAGPIRNKQMAEFATHLIAFWDGKSKGTKNMIELARKAGLVVHIIYI